MAINEIILKGRKKRVCYDSTPDAKKWYKISEWTHADDVEFDDGSILSVVINNIKNLITNINIALSAKADVLTVNRTVWISPSGNDNTGDGSETNPWRSIQKALDNVPIINGNAEYLINMQPGTYSNFIAANCSARFKLLGDVTIQCTGTYSIRVNNSIIAFQGEGHTLNLVGSDFGIMLYIQNSGMVNTYQLNMTVTGTKIDRGIGIELVSNGGFSLPDDGIVFNNLKTAIDISTNSRFHAGTVSGENIGTGVSVKSGGIVTYETNTIVATTPIESKSGGRVYEGTQE